MAFPTKIATFKSLNPYFPHNQALQCNSTRPHVKSLNCIPLQQPQAESGIMCESCSGRGWLLCDFCKGQKINIRSDNNRIYRRCPSCRAIGSILCSKCKVYKCVTFPDQNDGEELNF